MPETTKKICKKIILKIAATTLYFAIFFVVLVTVPKYSSALAFSFAAVLFLGALLGPFIVSAYSKKKGSAESETFKSEAEKKRCRRLQIISRIVYVLLCVLLTVKMSFPRESMLFWLIAILEICVFISLIVLSTIEENKK